MPYQKTKTQTLRQFQILKRLYSMEVLSTKQLAKEFETSQRTIQRDFQFLSSLFPLTKVGSAYRLDIQSFKGNKAALHTILLDAFACNVDIETLYIDRSNIAPAKVAFAIEYNKLPKLLGEKIADALLADSRCSFEYHKPQSITQREVDPIKLYTENGRWYLVARDYKDDKVKTFNLSKIKQLNILHKPTTLTDEMLQEAEEIYSIWSSGSREGEEVHLYVKANIADYIQDIKLHKTQKIIDRHYDGSLEVVCTITHKLEILPAIKSWLPYVHIIEPKWLWDDLMRDLEYYKDEDHRITT